MPNEGPPITEMAPPDEEWHILYATNMNKVFGLLAELTQHPSFQNAQDLGDFAEALHTLSTFRPHTREDFEKTGRMRAGI